MKRSYTQAQVDAKMRRLVAKKLTQLIARYDGSAPLAKEILRGLAAARKLSMDCRRFEDALAKRHGSRTAA